MNLISSSQVKLRIRAYAAALTIASMGLMAVLLISWGWFITNQRLIADAGHRAVRDTNLLREQINLQLLPAQATLRQISMGQLPSMAKDVERQQGLEVLLSALHVNPLVASTYVAYPNGDFVLARRLTRPDIRQRIGAPEAAMFLIQMIGLQKDGRRVGSFQFLDKAGKSLGIQERPNYTFDPRARSWYTMARESAGKVQISPPYRFATTNDLGVTLSERSAAVDAVVGIDIAFDDLEQLLVALRPTPGTRLALLHGNGRVVVATMRNANRDGKPTLDNVNEPQLLRLQNASKKVGKPMLLDVDGERWIGLHTQLHAGNSGVFDLLQVLPLNELIAEDRQRALHNTGLAAALALLLLPLSWVVGGAIGQSLDSLRERSQRIGRFDFSGEVLPPSHVREVGELSQAMQHMGDTIEAFLCLSESLASDPEVEHMLQSVLDKMTQVTDSNSATVYLWDAQSAHMRHMAQAGPSIAPLPEQFPYTPLPASVVAARAHYAVSHLDIELRGRQGNLKGLLTLEYRADAGHQNVAFERFAQRLSGMLALAIETRQLIEAQRHLFDALIRLMADAIDAKSPYTGGHCERVPQMAIELADRLNDAPEGPYADFHMSENERDAFRLGAWLHDCGKVTTPEHIVDKATKLEVIRNRIHEVRLRFEILWRDAELAAARGELDASQLAERHRQLRDDFAFVASCNEGSEFMPDEAIARLQSIATQGWLRHFDDRLGLSAAELKQMEAVQPVAPALPTSEVLLADLPEHRVPWGENPPAVETGDPLNTLGFDMKRPACQQNLGELYNLSIRRGTLTFEDRFVINNHIVQTYIMLKGLPWPAGLERVPELAATHHERLDGKGYPRGLAGERLGVMDRVMAMCDVFEALTANDRPYKLPKTLSETLQIMARMCNDQHLDSTLFRYFLRSGLCANFASRFLLPEQRDAVDLDALEASLLPPPISGAALSHTPTCID